MVARGRDRAPQDAGLGAGVGVDAGNKKVVAPSKGNHRRVAGVEDLRRRWSVQRRKSD
jgi:hypothetical protein